MCLEADWEATDRFKEEHKEPFTVYKVFRFYTLDSGKVLVSPYRRMSYNIGLTVSDRPITQIERENHEDQVELGLHVCLTKEEAERIIGYLGIYEGMKPENCVIAQCVINPVDIVAVGTFSGFMDYYNRPTKDTENQEIVVTQLSITEEEYKKATEA